ncbi:hypothetical protein [Cellvibrio fibrivorans]|uniref:Uncharacterized protein n=1 Tax=Cellvibrio fibrivorans TaxID=126350 RepID=A0ABU1V443_9GAMM|nr:hypothetical protein [Cellvibrio fibrivorans]MDR7092216.1 hypothetical protein [Cellvibrio fibrivorans]
MEEFSLNMELSGTDARQDKISLFIGSWDINAMDVLMTAFVVSLGDPTRSHPTFQTIAFQQNNHVSNIITKKVKFFRSKSGRGYKRDAPLFTGELVIKRKLNNLYRLNLLVDINPTRFCVYQHTPIRTRASNGIRNLSPSIVLFATQDKIRHGNGEDLEFTLDQSDNCLLTPSSKINASHPLYTDNLNRYLSSIVRYLEDEILEFQQTGFALLGKEEHYSVRNIETYWDIPCPTPTITLRQLEPLIRTSTNKLDINEYLSNELAGSTFSINDLTPCYTCYFRNGESLKLYAKTNKKIRLEVKYNFMKDSTLRSAWGTTPTNINRLFEFINYCSDMSTSTANDLISCLARNDTTRLRQEKSLVEFINSIYMNAPKEHATSILRMLASTDGITSSKAPEHLKSSLDKLVEKGVLMKQSGLSTRYIPQPRYLAASRKLVN